MTAFYDDSGEFNPGGRKFACFGMCVVPTPHIRKCSDAWWEMLGQHFQFSGSLPINGIEVKSSELNAMLRDLKNKSKLNEVQQKMCDHGLDNVAKVNDLIEAVFGFLGKPPVLVKYLAVIANKEEAWQKFYPDQINRWRILAKSRESPKELKLLRNELSSFLIKHTYEYLLQRLDYLHKDSDFEFSDAFVVGDQTSSPKVMLETQAEIQAGLGKFSELPTIVNRSWWGSSLYDPCLQMADWIAFAVRRWAEGNFSPIRHLLPNFRGYPDPDKLIGRGIVSCPNKECFPNLLPKISEPSRTNALPDRKRLII